MADTKDVLWMLLFGALCVYLGWVLHKDYIQQKTLPCHVIGYTLIEHGVGVTNCGDTVLLPKKIKFVE